MSTEAKPRKYTKQLRAEQEAETRERIAAAAVKLHGTVGPAQTTVSGVAKEAGVQRATVYRHFPTEESLFEACTAHYWARHPLPDVGPLARGSVTRHSASARGYAQFYDFYEEVEPMIEKTSRDAPLVPAMDVPRAAFMGFLDAAAANLAAGRPERGAARRRVKAAIGHALFFPTWQSLRGVQGLSNAEAVAVMGGMIDSAGRSRPR